MIHKKLIWAIIVVSALIVISIAVILILEKGKVRPDSIDVQCKFACENAQKTGFCLVERKVNDNLMATCDELSKNLSYAQYNVEKCPAVSCEPTPQELDKTCVTGLNSTWVTPTTEGTCPPQENKFVRKRSPSDKPAVPEQICCFYYN